MHSLMYLLCLSQLLRHEKNKCIRNDIKLCVFFLCALHFKMSASKPKRQHTDQTIKEKIKILGKLDCGVKAVDLCKQFNLSQSTLSTWKKQRCKLNEMVDAGKVLNTKQNCESFLPQVERALHLWFCEMRSKPYTPLINNHYLFRSQHCKYFIIVSTVSTFIPLSLLYSVQICIDSIDMKPKTLNIT